MSERFSEIVYHEAASINIDDVLRNRQIISGFTVDGINSMDLDDGIFLYKKDSNYILQVSISDVTSVIKPESELFTMAMNRVETVYYEVTNKPMLPKLLSENKLSLLPDSLKPAITFEMEIKPDLEVKNFEIYETAFRNIRKLDYTTFDFIANEKDNSPEYLLFREMSELALALLDSRRNKGALAVYDLKKGLYTNEEGIILPIRKEFAHISNIVIQEFMILTNKTIAKFFAEKDLPFIYRNHTAKQLAPSRNEILEQFNVAILNPKYLETLSTKSRLWFNRAKYSTILQGHFGLNEPAYSHVTSPIRRMADLLNHYLIKSYIHLNKSTFEIESLVELTGKINEIVLKHREDRDNKYKQKFIWESIKKFDFSSDNELLNINKSEFVTVLFAAAKNNVINEKLKNTINERLHSSKLDINMVFIILFIPSNESKEWLEIKNETLLYASKKIGMPLNLLNMLYQKGILKDFDSEYKVIGKEFITKIFGTVNDKQISTPFSNPADRKKIAMHDSALNFIRLIMDLPIYLTEEKNFIEKSENNIAQDTDKPKIVENTNNKPNEINNNFLISFKKLKAYYEEGIRNIAIDESSNNIVGKSINDNFVGKLLEICSKNTSWEQPNFEYSSSGMHHALVFKCKGTLITPNVVIEVESTASTKKIAKNEVSNKIIKKLTEINIINSNTVSEQHSTITNNYVSKLQEYCVKNSIPIADYDFEKKGLQHQPSFNCYLKIMLNDESREFIGKGQTKQIAKQDAAEKCYLFLLNNF